MQIRRYEQNDRHFIDGSGDGFRWNEFREKRI